MRQYWVPALMSSELAGADCAPVRVLLLGEQLIAFRDSAGQVGLLAANCPHRGASLFFGRNEGAGCAASTTAGSSTSAGRCVDMPSEPAESNFKDKIRATAYPVRRARWRLDLHGAACSRRPHRCPISSPACCRMATAWSRPPSASATGCRGWKATSTPATPRFCTRARYPSRRQSRHVRLL